jgi:hypothetical protein
VVNCLLWFGVGLSTFYLQKTKTKQYENLLQIISFNVFKVRNSLGEDGLGQNSSMQLSASVGTSTASSKLEYSYIQTLASHNIQEVREGKREADAIVIVIVDIYI